MHEQLIAIRYLSHRSNLLKFHFGPVYVHVAVVVDVSCDDDTLPGNKTTFVQTELGRHGAFNPTTITHG